MPKKVYGKADARALTGPEVAARALNAREREQRLQERERLAIDISLGPRTLMPTATEMPQYGPRDIAVVIGPQDKEFIIRVTPPLTEAISMT